jgi:hypothetical protein
LRLEFGDHFDRDSDGIHWHDHDHDVGIPESACHQ